MIYSMIDLSSWASELIEVLGLWAGLVRAEAEAATTSGSLHKRNAQLLIELAVKLQKRLEEYVYSCDRQTRCLRAQLLSVADVETRSDHFLEIRRWLDRSLGAFRSLARDELLQRLYFGELRGFPSLVDASPTLQDNALLDGTIESLGGFVPNARDLSRLTRLEFIT